MEIPWTDWPWIIAIAVFVVWVNLRLLRESKKKKEKDE